MKSKYLITNLLLICGAYSFSQENGTPGLRGWWINTQYEFYKGKSDAEEILYKVSPWFIYIDDQSRCSIELTFEQKADLGFPASKKENNGIWEYHYKNNYDVWLYEVRDNDSLLIYSNGITPGAGIVFRRYK